jgi:hypothetical protein
MWASITIPSYPIGPSEFAVFTPMSKCKPTPDRQSRMSTRFGGATTKSRAKVHELAYGLPRSKYFEN